MKLKFNTADLQRIKGKLDKLNGNLNSVTFKWRIDLLNEYGAKVSGLMGTVSGRGGYPALEFSGVAEQGPYWEPLAFMRNLRKDGSQYNTKTTIWYETGRTKQSFQVVDNWVGVESEYAMLTEMGGTNAEDHTVPARPLFSFANHLVRKVIAQACKDPSSVLGNRIRRELKEFIGWGQ